MKPIKYASLLVSIVFVFITMQISAAQTPAKPVAAASQPTTSVKIENFTFEPKELQIAAGTTVIWQNAGDVGPHANFDPTHGILHIPVPGLPMIGAQPPGWHVPVRQPGEYQSEQQ